MTTKDDVIAAVKENHMWINAFALVNPTDELALGIGRDVIAWLQNRENLLPKYVGENEALAELAELTPMLYMSINAS